MKITEEGGPWTALVEIQEPVDHRKLRELERDVVLGERPLLHLHELHEPLLVSDELGLLPFDGAHDVAGRGPLVRVVVELLRGSFVP